MTWRNQLTSMLRDGMRYCFPLGQGFAPLDSEVFEGTADEAGFADQVCNLVADLRRELFFEAYRLGAMDAISDLNPRDPAHGGVLYEFDAELNKAGAWKRWGEVDKL